MTIQPRHFDGHPYAAKGWQFPSCNTKTLLQCSDGTLAQNGKFEALNGTNSTAGETCAVGCDLGDELVPGDGLRTHTYVRKNESVARLTGSLSVCRLTRRSTCINLRKIGVSEDCEPTSRTAPLSSRLYSLFLSLPTILSLPASSSASRKV